MRKRDDFEDDGRTIADMSGIGPAPTLRPHRRKADAPPPEPANDRPWEQAPDWTPKIKRHVRLDRSYMPFLRAEPLRPRRLGHLPCKGRLSRTAKPSEKRRPTKWGAGRAEQGLRGFGCLRRYFEKTIAAM